MTDSKFGVWTNCATWRVSRLIDGTALEDFGVDPDDGNPDTSDVAAAIRSWVSELLDDGPDGLVKDYANASLSGVNWCEISAQIIAEYEELENRFLLQSHS